MNTTPEQARKARKRLHFSNFAGFPTTACGRSLHGWQGSRTPVATSNPRDVTCKRCQVELKA